MPTARAENLWTVDHVLRLPLGIPFPGRMTVVRLDGGSLALVSPVPIDDRLAGELAALGPVSHLVAPNLLHHLHLAAAKRRYPEARVLGPEGLGKKESSLRIEPLEAGAEAFGSTLRSVLVEGAPRISESVLLHAPSRTLVVTDLVFAFERAPSWSTALLLRSTGTLGRLAQSRVWSFSLRDPGAARASSERVLSLDFDRLVVAHGDVIDTGGRERLAAALTRTIPPRK